MRSAIALTAAAALASATPVKRATNIDSTILNYALTLEHLESKFYREGLANFTSKDFAAAGFPEPFYTNLKAVSADENTHVSFLTSALQAAKYPATAECTYNFPVKDAKSFIQFASIVEGVGVSAYTGAAALISNPGYLTAAGSILTVESRHSAYMRKLLKQSPFPTPFDVPLDFDEVYSLVAPFITGCPKTNPALPVKAFPALTASGPRANGVIKAKDLVLFKTTAKTSGTVYVAFITVTGPVFTQGHPTEGGYHIYIPDNALIKGQSYAVLTSDNKSVTDDNTLAGPAIVEIS